MFEAGVTGPLHEGARVQTAKGVGTVHKIADEVTWTDGKRVRKSLVIVQLDDRPPSAVRSVFYADRVKLVEAPNCGCPEDDDELIQHDPQQCLQDDVEVEDDASYEPDDPKHPTYRERMADAADQFRKAEKENAGDPED